jgi:hypothetical protein
MQRALDEYCIHDELKIARQSGAIFGEYFEPQITFLPTYKYNT